MKEEKVVKNLLKAYLTLNYLYYKTYGLNEKIVIAIAMVNHVKLLKLMNVSFEYIPQLNALKVDLQDSIKSLKQWLDSCSNLIDGTFMPEVSNEDLALNDYSNMIDDNKANLKNALSLIEEINALLDVPTVKR